MSTTEFKARQNGPDILRPTNIPKMMENFLCVHCFHVGRRAIECDGNDVDGNESLSLRFVFFFIPQLGYDFYFYFLWFSILFLLDFTSHINSRWRSEKKLLHFIFVLTHSPHTMRDHKCHTFIIILFPFPFVLSLPHILPFFWPFIDVGLDKKLLKFNQNKTKSVTSQKPSIGIGSVCSMFRSHNGQRQRQRRRRRWFGQNLFDYFRFGTNTERPFDSCSIHKYAGGEAKGE